MNRTPVTAAFLCVAFITFFSGIIRHDVKEDLHIALALQKQFDCVGQVLRDTTPAGSCVLIGDRFVLSAAHVFIESGFKDDTVVYQGMKLVSRTAVAPHPADVSKCLFLFSGKKYAGKSLKIHETYLSDLSKRQRDIAVIELAEIVKEVVPARISEAADERGAEVVGVGFGASGVASQPEGVKLSGKKIAGENVVDSITGYKLNGKPTGMLCDFDHPADKTCNRMGSATPRPLEYISSGGDSGGGLFRLRNGSWQLVGVCTGSGVDVNRLLKTGYYGQIMEWTRVSVFAGWIRQQLKK